MRGPTIEQKALAFDRLCNVAHEGLFVRYKFVLIQSTSGFRDPGTTVDNSPKYREVPIYRWELYSEGESDFARMALKGIWP